MPPTCPSLTYLVSMVFTRKYALIISAGLIQNEDEEVVNLVRQLTESYIKRPNTIILTTIPMSGT